MPEIALGNRRKITWWPFILVGLGIVLLVGIVLTQRDEGTPIQLKAPPDKATEGPYAGTITDLAMLVGPTSHRLLVGRDVALKGVEVQQVLGDHTFLVGHSLGQRALILYDPPAGSTAAEPRIAPGDTVAVQGVVRAIPGDPMTLSALEMDRLRPSERAEMAIYVDAPTVMVTVDESGR